MKISMEHKKIVSACVLVVVVGAIAWLLVKCVGEDIAAETAPTAVEVEDES